MAGRDKGAVQLPKVKLPMQFPRCFYCYTREADIWPEDGRLLTLLRKPYCPKYLPPRILHTFHTSCTSRSVFVHPPLPSDRTPVATRENCHK